MLCISLDCHKDNFWPQHGELMNQSDVLILEFTKGPIL